MHDLGLAALPINLVVLVVQTVTIIFVRQIIVNIQVVNRLLTPLLVAEN